MIQNACQCRTLLYKEKWHGNQTTTLLTLKHSNRRESTRQWADHTEIWCGDEWPEMTSSSPSTNQSSHSLYSKKIYYTIVSLILYVLPSLIMTVAYGVIMRTLWANKLPGEHISCMEHAQNRKKKKVKE